jgi:hypothetical protein
MDGYFRSSSACLKCKPDETPWKLPKEISLALSTALLWNRLKDISKVDEYVVEVKKSKKDALLENIEIQENHNFELGSFTSVLQRLLLNHMQVLSFIGKMNSGGPAVWSCPLQALTTIFLFDGGVKCSGIVPTALPVPFQEMLLVVLIFIVGNQSTYQYFDVTM